MTDTDPITAPAEPGHGCTTAQMLGAPIGALFVWSSNDCFQPSLLKLRFGATSPDASPPPWWSTMPPP